MVVCAQGVHVQYPSSEDIPVLLGSSTAFWPEQIHQTRNTCLAKADDQLQLCLQSENMNRTQNMDLFPWTTTGQLHCMKQAL